MSRVTGSVGSQRSEFRLRSPCFSGSRSWTWTSGELRSGLTNTNMITFLWRPWLRGGAVVPLPEGGVSLSGPKVLVQLSSVCEREAAERFG